MAQEVIEQIAKMFVTVSNKDRKNPDLKNGQVRHDQNDHPVTKVIGNRVLYHHYRELSSNWSYSMIFRMPAGQGDGRNHSPLKSN